MTDTASKTATVAMPVMRSVPLVGDEPAMRDWAADLVARARAEGVELTGDNGLLTGLVRTGAADRPGSRDDRSSRLRTPRGCWPRYG
jgi:hypothetical protein